MQCSRQVSLTEIIIRTVGLSSIAFVLGGLCFRDSLAMACTGLVSIGLSPLMNELLEENREQIWEQSQNPWKANLWLAAQISTAFMGILAVSLLFAGLAPDTYLINAGFQPSHPGRHAAVELFISNYPVLIVGMVLGFSFGPGGLVLVLAWNAINWAQTLLWIATESKHHPMLKLISFFPHLLLEVSAYITAGIAGVFWAKAFRKYKIASVPFIKVEWAVMTLLLVAVGVLLVAAFWESLVLRMG